MLCVAILVTLLWACSSLTCLETSRFHTEILPRLPHIICLVLGNFTIFTGDTDKFNTWLLFEYNDKYSGNAAINWEPKHATDIGGRLEIW